jgi:hypothetical protein
MRRRYLLIFVNRNDDRKLEVVWYLVFYRIGILLRLRQAQKQIE